MLYHGYRITFTGYDQDAAVFLISKRHSDEVLAKTSSASKAIDLIDIWGKQLNIQFTEGDNHATAHPGRITESATGEAALERMASPDLPKR